VVEGETKPVQTSQHNQTVSTLSLDTPRTYKWKNLCLYRV